MKHSFCKYFAAALLLALPLAFASCEGSLDDIFGEWDKPSSKVPASAVEEAKVLGAALEKGAIVTVTYTVGSTTYTAKFEKGDGDNYTLISNTSGAGARAMTRAATPGTVPEGAGSVVGDKIRLVLEGGKLKLVVKDTNDAPLFEAHMNVEGGETAVFNTNALGLNCGISTFAVNEVKKDIKINVMKGANVSYDYEFTIESSVYYAKFESVVLYDEDKRETWADVIARYKDINQIGTTDDGIVTMSFNKEVAIDVIKGVSGLSASDDIIGELANTVSQIKFYLYTKEEVNWSARAMTRVSSTYKYTPVKSTDVVDCTKTYILSPAMGHALTSAAVGELIGSDGKAYDVDYKNDLSSIGVKAVAMVAYMGSDACKASDAPYNHGLALAMKDAGTATWCTKSNATCLGNQYTGWDDAKLDMAGIDNTDDLVGHGSHTHAAAKAARDFQYIASVAVGTHPDGTSAWFLPSAGQLVKMIDACKNVLGNNNSYEDLRDAFSSRGGTNLQSDSYWLSTEHGSNFAWVYKFDTGEGATARKDYYNDAIRPAIAF